MSNNNFYEIVILLRPERDEAVEQIQQDIQSAVLEVSGKIDRFENIGLRQLAYPIKFLHKAIYLIFNIECTTQCLFEIERELKLNDSVLRQLIIKCDKAIVTESVLLKQTRELRDQKNKSVSDRPRETSEEVSAEQNEKVSEKKSSAADKELPTAPAANF